MKATPPRGCSYTTLLLCVLRLLGVLVLFPNSIQAFAPPYTSSLSFCSTKRRFLGDEAIDLMRRSMQTAGHDAAVETALPLLFGRWTLDEKRLVRPLWGQKPVKHAGALGIADGDGSRFEVLLLPKGRVDQPLDSALRGLDWRLSFKDMYATGRLEFKIVHPPPDKKLIANDQIPHTHYYSGVFCDGLDRVEGWVERYADVEDDKLGPIRRKVRIGQFCLMKVKEREKSANTGGAMMAVAAGVVA
ncbi:hypothetical protein VYU27_000068 [Nannochloropsis oceanica]